MTQEESFIAEIADSPDDDGPRLVFADWLSDHDQEERAELIRVQCELARREVEGTETEELSQRARELLKANEERWSADLPACQGWGKYGSPARGLVEHVWVKNVERFLADIDELFRRAPIRSLTVRYYGEPLGPLLNHPCMSRIEQLMLQSNNNPPDLAPVDALAESTTLVRLRTLSLQPGSLGVVGGLRTLLSAPWLSSLRRLILEGNSIRGDAAEALASCPALGGLERLELKLASLRDGGAEHLARSPYLRRLTHLDLEANVIGAAGARALGQSPNFEHLRWLALTRNDLTDAGGHDLFRSGNMPRLETLLLDHTGVGPQTMAALAGSATLGQLRELNCAECPLGAGGARALASATRVPPLQSLKLRNTGLGDEGAEALARWPALRTVESLDLSSNGLTAAGVEALLSSGHLTRLQHLDLTGCPITDAGVPALARWPALATLHTLNLREAGLRGGALGLARSPYLGSLKELDLSGNDLSPEARQAFRELDESGRLFAYCDDPDDELR